MAASMSPYELWLSDKLVSLNSDVDGEVFVTYISGILDTDTSNEEKKESLEGIIAEVASDNIDKVCDEIIAKWEEMNSNKDDSQENKTSVDEQLSKILSTQKLTVSKGRELTPEEKARKAAILAQYSEVCEGGSDDSVSDEEEGAVGGGDADFLIKNTNKADVDKNEREKREKAKKDSENKKEKDRLDREAQKAKNQERKDTEKKRTQKGERRR